MNQKNLDMLDVLNILSFAIGLANYNENMTQGDKQDLMSALNEQTVQVLSEIHKHLDIQDMLLHSINERLEALENDR